MTPDEYGRLWALLHALYVLGADPFWVAGVMVELLRMRVVLNTRQQPEGHRARVQLLKDIPEDAWYYWVRQPKEESWK
jgi:hypothetical protein